jgi:hypothetical protein
LTKSIDQDSGYFTFSDKIQDMLRRRIRFLALVAGALVLMPIILAFGDEYSAANYFGFLQASTAAYGVFWYAIVVGK